ncbi:hypothetical protein EON63_17150 [archaeon]|nr:MAG: hypothetical protein EON63_17150 [archaeon]
MDCVSNRAGVGAKKRIVITHNMRVLQIKCKEYKGHGMLYHFMLEELMDYGPNNVGKFASTYQQQLLEFWKRLRQIILVRREIRAKQNKRLS